jgi:hypothetical protein
MKYLAKKVGAAQEVRMIGSYDGDESKYARERFGDECGIVTIHEMIDAEGNITEVESASY